mgnify:CR=1 FL=1
MAVEIKMPRLSQTTDEVRFIRWLVQEGDAVKKGDPLCEVETDKVTMEVESFTDGRVLELITRPDTVIDAGTVIAVLGSTEEKLHKKPGFKEYGPKPQTHKTAYAAGKVTTPEGAGKNRYPGSSKRGSMHNESSAGVATPLVKNIAQKRGIDLQLVRGTGPGGLVTKHDLEQFERKSGVHEPAGKTAVVSRGKFLSSADERVQKDLKKGTSGKEKAHSYS